MPRKSVPNGSDFPFHITARCHNRDLFPVRPSTAWSIFEDFLFLVHSEYSLSIHSFVMMPNHFHMLASAPRGNMSEAMMYFMRETSREIGRLSRTSNQQYGGRHHKSLIENNHYFMNAYKYIYRNPVRARISRRCVEYKYSTLAGLCGNSPLTIPLSEDALLFDPSFNQNTFDWLHRPVDADHELELKRALRKPIFKLVQPQKTKRKSQLETALY